MLRLVKTIEAAPVLSSAVAYIENVETAVPEIVVSLISSNLEAVAKGGLDDIAALEVFLVKGRILVAPIETYKQPVSRYGRRIFNSEHDVAVRHDRRFHLEDSIHTGSLARGSS